MNHHLLNNYNYCKPNIRFTPLYLHVSDGFIVTTKEFSPSTFVNYNEHHELIGIEVLSHSGIHDAYKLFIDSII